MYIYSPDLYIKTKINHLDSQLCDLYINSFKLINQSPSNQNKNWIIVHYNKEENIRNFLLVDLIHYDHINPDPIELMWRKAQELTHKYFNVFINNPNQFY